LFARSVSGGARITGVGGVQGLTCSKRQQNQGKQSSHVIAIGKSRNTRGTHPQKLLHYSGYTG
jgi:hypothetical protein